MTRAELKAQAKSQLKGKVGMFFLCSLIVGIITIVGGMIPLVGALITLLISIPLSIGLILIYLDVTNNLDIKLERLFDGFKYFWKAFVLMLLVGVFTWLWTLLFIIPGIIKAYSYSMSFYILAENPEMTALEALNESKRIMQGHKMELFVLELSFILWDLLYIVTFGIAGIWIMPYMQLTITNFYHSIKDKKEIPTAETVTVEY